MFSIPSPRTWSDARSRWYVGSLGSILGHLLMSSGTNRPTICAMAPLTLVSSVGLSYSPTTRYLWFALSFSPSPLTPYSLRLTFDTFPAESRVATTVAITLPVSASSRRTSTP
jgi:hypothetical protein